MRYIITHGHIFKNAGSTVDTALKNAFGKDFLDHRDDKSMRQGGSEYLAQLILDNPNIKAISSHHLCNPLPVSKEFTCIPIYFVRNPIERIISVYNFERSQKKGSNGAAKASSSSLIDYVEWRLEKSTPKVICNYQTAYIGSERNLKPEEDVNPRCLINIFEKIRNGEILVGTVENFDTSWRIITHKLSLYFPGYKFLYKNANIKDKKSSHEKLDSAITKLDPLLPKLLKENVLDLALHQYVTQSIHCQDSEN
ncbi:sulfotransferase family 2 domain-containing protein [Halioxenophilus aromaticivorans]|uniref:Sulfotransferase family protein n=1 Tax=Halioxenophilus aromaticivorans TaxID=1306992 RepID=A0AAV3U1E7_9ALTE